MNVVRRLFNRIFRHPAGIPGRLGGVIMARRNRRMARRAIELLDVQPGDRVLDIGCGPGVGIQLLARSTAAEWTAGLDPSGEMVEQARARNAAAIDARTVALRQGYADRLPFESATFDKALSVKSMQIWPDAAAGLREIRRVLRPGGRIVLGFTDHSGLTKAGLAGVLTRAGYVDPRVVGSGRVFYAFAIKPDRDK